MSQHSFAIVNEAGASFRGDVNSALQALASCSRGASAPATTYAGQVWDDSTANVQKKRNAANSAWIAKMTLDEAFVVARSSNTILGVSDVGKTIVATTTFTQTVTAAATLGDGWWVEYRNDGTGIITLDPNSSETIDNATTLNLYPGESCTINCNGAAFKTVGRGSGPVLIQRQSVSAVAQVDFALGIDGTFDEYWVTVADLVTATDNVELWLRVSEDAGSSFKSGASDYAHERFGNNDGGAIGNAGLTADTKILLAGALSNSKAFGMDLRFGAPSGTSRHKLFRGECQFEGSGLTISSIFAVGVFKLDTNAINGIRFLASSGNITAGIFSLYGVRKS